jgi:ubiquinol-cytochrome c reductase cytochrome c1 subunit
MPNPLWQLQGEREPVYEERKEHGQTTHVFVGWKQVTAGTLSQKQYDKTVGDLVNYMHWMAEPAQNNRVRLGVWVLLFLAGFTFIAWRLNAAYWKDVK